jgi:hypothetical protein
LALIALSKGPDLQTSSIAVGTGRLRSGLIALAAIWVVSSCSTPELGAKEHATASVSLSELSEGYSLLYDLLSKEKHSSLLSIFKKESPELKGLLERVSETSKATTRELDTLAKLNPPVTLKAPHLPRLEQAARESIHKETGKEILHSNGVDLEFNMVSSQLAGMNYAAHLARALAAVETNPVRREFLQRTDRNYSKLHGQMYKMLFARYQRSSKSSTQD